MVRASRIGLVASSLLATVTGLAGEARAQSEKSTRTGLENNRNDDGMDLHLFRPAIDSKGFFSVNGADILGKNDLSLGLVIDYGHVLMPLNKGHRASELVEHVF